MMKNEIIRLGKLEVHLRELSEFLAEAKKNSYASGKGRNRLKDNSKSYIHKKGNFFYINTYAGSLQVSGFELVKWKYENGPWIWFMSYAGGMLPQFWEDKELTGKTHHFLKEVLLKVTPEAPIRGPEVYKSPAFNYVSSIRGDINGFHGKEKIINRGAEKIVFSQDFIGGLVVPKERK